MVVVTFHVQCWYLSIFNFVLKKTNRRGLIYFCVGWVGGAKTKQCWKKKIQTNAKSRITHVKFFWQNEPTYKYFFRHDHTLDTNSNTLHNCCFLATYCRKRGVKKSKSVIKSTNRVISFLTDKQVPTHALLIFYTNFKTSSRYIIPSFTPCNTTTN